MFTFCATHAGKETTEGLGKCQWMLAYKQCYSSQSILLGRHVAGELLTSGIFAAVKVSLTAELKLVVLLGCRNDEV